LGKEVFIEIVIREEKRGAEEVGRGGAYLEELRR
jgi:hypothetical protein